MERKNLNRGFKQLRVWQDSSALYVKACKVFLDFPFELKRVASNSIDACHSISRNIAEGYCRKSLKEYLAALNIARGSCGEFHSCYESFRQAHQISEAVYEEIDELHFKVENELLKLIERLQQKLLTGTWEEIIEPQKSSRHETGQG
jgi:four helix bundle protein